MSSVCVAVGLSLGHIVIFLEEVRCGKVGFRCSMGMEVKKSVRELKSACCLYTCRAVIGSYGNVF